MPTPKQIDLEDYIRVQTERDKRALYADFAIGRFQAAIDELEHFPGVGTSIADRHDIRTIQHPQRRRRFQRPACKLHAQGLPPVPKPGPGPMKRRQRLPDIDEINSSLRASADRAGDIAAQGTLQGRQDTRAGFRLGFSTVLLLATLALLVYAYAPQLAGRVPALTPLLDSYVAAVDAARIWLDGQLRAVIAAMQAEAPQG